MIGRELAPSSSTRGDLGDRAGVDEVRIVQSTRGPPDDRGANDGDHDHRRPWVRRRDGAAADRQGPGEDRGGRGDRRPTEARCGSRGPGRRARARSGSRPPRRAAEIGGQATDHCQLLRVLSPKKAGHRRPGRRASSPRSRPLRSAPAGPPLHAAPTPRTDHGGDWGPGPPGTSRRPRGEHAVDTRRAAGLEIKSPHAGVEVEIFGSRTGAGSRRSSPRPSRSRRPPAHSDS